MKIIEAMKQIKDLQRKASDIKDKVAKCSACMDVETPLYQNQGEVVAGWVQAYEDIVKEILRLRIAIQRTNLATMVGLELDGKTITKSIAEWVHRRRDLARLSLEVYTALTDRGLKEGWVQQSNGEKREVKIVRFYNPLERDKKLDEYRSEPVVIDGRLEVVNAVTDLIEN